MPGDTTLPPVRVETDFKERLVRYAEDRNAAFPGASRRLSLNTLTDTKMKTNNTAGHQERRLPDED
jgi:hypothetical protein